MWLRPVTVSCGTTVLICFIVDRPGPLWTGSYMGNPAPIGASLSDVSVIMVVMSAFVVKSLCQAVTGQTPLLECLFPGVHGCLWLCLVLV
jgi:hypothetical protein